MVNLKVFVLLSVIGLLSACTESKELGLKEAKAEYLCRDQGGLYLFRVIKDYPVTCKNGRKYSKMDLRKVIIEDPKFLPEGENNEN